MQQFNHKIKYRIYMHTYMEEKKMETNYGVNNKYSLLI